jgi:CRP-like cAMP-binding protein
MVSFPVSPYQDLEAGNILEEEGQNPRNMYLLLKGEVTFYKRPEALYDKSDKLVKFQDIGNILNPKDSGSERLGLPMSVFKGPYLLGEDAIVFADTNIYSLVTKTKCTLLALPAREFDLP